MPNRIVQLGLYLGYLAFVGLGFYEFTAKSDEWMGWNLPGTDACRRAEKTTRWDPPTGLFLVDRVLHETVEAASFYGTLVRSGP